jgi:hypothetical protein
MKRAGNTTGRGGAIEVSAGKLGGRRNLGEPERNYDIIYMLNANWADTRWQ